MRYAFPPYVLPCRELWPAALLLRVGRAVTVAILRRLAAGRRHHVDVGIVRAVAGKPRADLQQRDVGARADLQMMPVAVVGLEPSAITGFPDPQVATNAVGIPATPRSILKPSFSRIPVRYLEVSNS